MNISAPMTYKDKHGADKTKWVNIGSIVLGDDGKVFGDISAIPTGDWDGSFNCFDKEERSHNQAHQSQQPAPNGQPPVYQQNVDQYGNPVGPEQRYNR